jgi:hypothetical protein
MENHFSTVQITDGTEKTQTTQEVTTLALDDYCRWQNVCPDVVKVDVEGAEIGVLRGFEDALSHSPPDHLFIELHPEYIRERGKSPNQVKEIVRNHGYEFEQISAEGHRLHAFR